MLTVRKTNPLPLIWLALVFITPMIVSFVLFHYHDSFHFKTTNRGTLIRPVVNLPATKQWQIVYAPTKNCDAQCEKMIFTLHQLKIALGKDRNRVTLAVLNSNYPSAKEHEFTLLKLTTHQHQQLQSSIKQSLENKIYLIDPIGNIFMYYTNTTNPMNILKDIKHLLEVSQIG